MKMNLGPTPEDQGVAMHSVENRSSFGHLFSKAMRFTRIACRFVYYSVVRLYLKVSYADNIQIHPSVQIGVGCRIRCTDGGKIQIGPNVSLERNCEITVRQGNLRIGSDSYVGPGTIIVCQDTILIEAQTLIAEYVTIRDQNHNPHDFLPISESGYFHGAYKYRA